MDFYTIPELAKSEGWAEWTTRRAVDKLGISMPRAGNYRLVPAPLVPAIRELIGSLDVEETASE